MSQYQSAYQSQAPRNTRLKSLATSIAAATLMIAGSAGIAVAATSSSASAPPSAAGNAPQTCELGYVVDGICVLRVR